MHKETGRELLHFVFAMCITTETVNEPATAIQIVDLVDHSFHLKSDDFKSILERDEIKDRNVVVVSIAGAFRQGKSFLLNFFLKYLCAQVICVWFFAHT